MRGLRHFLNTGGVVAYPTEAVFGLGCDPNNRKAVQRILKIKGRPQHKGLILVDDVLNSGTTLIYAVRHFLDVPLTKFKTFNGLNIGLTT